MKRFRLGVYDPLDLEAPVKFFGDVFRDTPLEHRIMRRTVKLFNRWATKRRRVLAALGIFQVQRRRKIAN